MPDSASWQGSSWETARPKAETSGPVPGANRKQHLPAALEDANVAWVALSSILRGLLYLPVAVSITRETELVDFWE